MSETTNKIKAAAQAILDGAIASKTGGWVGWLFGLFKQYPWRVALCTSLLLNGYMGWMTFVQPRLDFASRHNITEAIDLSDVKDWQSCILKHMKTDTPGRQIFVKCREFE